MEGKGTPFGDNFGSDSSGGAQRTLADIWGSRRPQDGDEPKLILADIWSGDGREPVENPRLSDIADPGDMRQAGDPEAEWDGVAQFLLEQPRTEPVQEDRLLPPGDDESLETLLNRAMGYLKANRVTDAILLLEQICASIDPVDRNQLVTLDRVRASLAKAYAMTGRPDLAVPLYESLLTDGAGRLRESERLGYRMKLAVVHRELGNVSEALELLETLLTELEAGSSIHRLRAIETQVELATTYLAADRPEDAVWMYQRVMPVVERTNGSDDRETLTVRVLLARAYEEVGETDQAIAVYRHVLAIAEPGLGLRDPVTACAYHELNTLLRSRVPS